MRVRERLGSLVNSMASHLPYDVLSRLVERRAAPIEEARAQRHLTSCGRCRSELAWLERIRSLPQRTSEIGHMPHGSEPTGDGWGNLGRAARHGSSALLG